MSGTTLRVWLIGLGLALITFVAFEPVRHGEFLGFDDDKYVSANAHVQAGLTRDSVGWALRASYFNNWHPLAWLSHMLDVELFGGDAAGAHHLSGLLLHVLNALLLFGVMRRMTGALWPSAFAAALFALHPLRVEAVAWLSERKELLSTCFGLLSILAYVGYTRRGGLPRYLLVVGLFALGLMAKPMLVTLPLLLLLLDYWPLERLESRPASFENLSRPQRSIAFLLGEKLPLLLLAAASSVVTVLVQSGSMEPAVLVSLKLRVVNALVSYVRYLGMMLWPVDLGLLYTHPNLPGGVPWTLWQVLGATLLLVAITRWVMRAHERRYALVGWLWYLIALLPVIGLLQVGEQALADRYTYFPMIGLCILVAWGGAEIWQRWLSRWARARGIVAVGAAAVLALLTLASRAQTAHWHDTLSLFERSLAVNPTNPTLHYNVAVVLEGKGEREEAIAHWRRALEFRPRFAKAHNNLAVMMVAQGKTDEALHHYREALRLDADYADAHYNLGSLLAARGQLDAGIAHYRAALLIEPDNADVHFKLANALVNKGELEEAIEHYRETLRIQPGHARAQRNLRIVLETSRAGQ